MKRLSLFLVLFFVSLQVLQAGIVDDNVKRMGVFPKKNFIIIQVVYSKDSKMLDVEIKSPDFIIDSISTKKAVSKKRQVVEYRCYHSEGKKFNTNIEITFKDAGSQETIIKSIKRVWWPYLLSGVVILIFIFSESGKKKKNSGSSNKGFRSTGNSDLDTILQGRRGSTTIFR